MPSHSAPARLASRPGPFVVLSKGHSGSRFLAEAMQRGGVFMGNDLNDAFDSMSWHEDVAVPLMTSRWFPHWPVDQADPGFDAMFEACLTSGVERYLGADASNGPWGWKGSTVFVTELLLRRFPDMRIFHLIRDGRDVVLSQDGYLNLPFHFDVHHRDPRKKARALWEKHRGAQQRDRYRKAVVFGDPDITRWNGITVDPDSMRDHRTTVQMQSWMRNVETIRTIGAGMGNRYLEVRYEDLCAAPVDTMKLVLDWAELPQTPTLLEFVEGAARTGSIGRWERLVPTMAEDRRRDFEAAVDLGRDLLVSLGYD